MKSSSFFVDFVFLYQTVFACFFIFPFPSWFFSLLFILSNIFFRRPQHFPPNTDRNCRLCFPISQQKKNKSDIFA